MNIYNLLGILWGEHERAHLSKSAIILYFRLIHEANKSFWQGPIVLSWEYLGRVLGIASDTLGRAISDLKSRGLITYERKGKHSYFWFPKHHLDNPSGNPSKNINHLDNPSQTPSGNPSENPSDYPSNINNKTIIQEYKKTKNNKNKEFPYGNSATNVANSWRKQLGNREKDIVDTWETLIGPFDPKWVSLISEVLKECYPAQIKNAIVTLAKTKAEVMQEQGFEYVVEPLRKGVFGRRRKSGNTKRSDTQDFKGNWAEKFKNPAGRESISDEEFEQYFITNDKRTST